MGVDGGATSSTGAAGAASDTRGEGAAGAGDAFAAGVLLGWHDGKPVSEQLRYGVCAAAANLSEETCTGGMKPLEECLKLGTRFGFRG